MFNNIDNAINWVITQTKFREKTNLDIMNQAYLKLGLNLKDLKKVHIAGTNGKGSTTAYISQTLMDNDIKVGSFTSPYLVDFNERLKINNLNISNEKLLEYINFFYKFNEDLFKEEKVKLSFFEILTLMAFKYFVDEKVDVILMEAGIGGRLDATNIINYDVSVITSIGYDHTKQLGNTLDLIAKEKIAILKKSGHLISAVKEPFKSNFVKYAKNLNASYRFIHEAHIKPISNYEFSYFANKYKLSMLGDYQRSNALMASEVVQYLYDINIDNIIPSLNKTIWPGRFEEIDKDVYIDGAHNVSAMKALRRNIENIFLKKEVTILFSALKNKDIEGMLNELKEVSNKIILTSFNDPRYESLEKYTKENIIYKKDGFKTFKSLIKNKKENEVIIATGSLHFIGYLKHNK